MAEERRALVTEGDQIIDSAAMRKLLRGGTARKGSGKKKETQSLIPGKCHHGGVQNLKAYALWKKTTTVMINGK